MASKPGRKNIPWIRTPVGRLAKCISHFLDKTPDALARFKRLNPQFMQMYPNASEAAILGRGMTTKRSHHKDRENVNINPYTKPYVPLAQLILERDAPYFDEELEKHLIAATAQVPVSKSSRRNIKKATKDEHYRWVWAVNGGRCPFCGVIEISRGGIRVPPAECDHFFTNQLPDFEHSWPLCEECHDVCSHNKIDRDEVYPAFREYQRKVKYQKLKAAE